MFIFKKVATLTRMYEILPNLFLAAFQEAKECPPNSFVVNCTRDLPMINDEGHRIPVDDNGTKESLDAMFLALPEAVKLIHQELGNNRPVVVHCLAGQQRSPIVICAYLMAKRGFTMEEAVSYVRSKKRDALFWTINFLDSLQRFSMFL